MDFNEAFDVVLAYRDASLTDPPGKRSSGVWVCRIWPVSDAPKSDRHIFLLVAQEEALETGHYFF